MEANVQTFYNPFVNSTYTIEFVENNYFVADGPRMIMKEIDEDFNLKVSLQDMYRVQICNSIQISKEMLKEKKFYLMTKETEFNRYDANFYMIVDEYEGKNAFMFCFPECALEKVGYTITDIGSDIEFWIEGTIGTQEINQKVVISSFERTNDKTYTQDSTKSYSASAVHDLIQVILKEKGLISE